ncbi:azole transporter KNAG_0K01020 [Huiozyma naganishii CBS 8797]|uniref:Major facilitator superfamily (MFS) profile domain-containing protein n=1 Tax=Huiozyma naganishii (strain ATCC MYA-139 / BCRC 22969 / CBS 8797 / KCTC 17520 / NBRC 10181 / NCYC 3082 / Yp74L-3) TaxID=1071383 RepID=J7S397_HUIN7|nr:hypothetical protein KNAG_0K01020 [Kazachstania naganishii CBS 8797]CCK72467.1 hypothetical protein KNAG_0K01020 [Kazachstania naganishii CBS 8797]
MSRASMEKSIVRGNIGIDIKSVDSVQVHTSKTDTAQTLEEEVEYNEFGQPLPKGIILWACTGALALANFLAALDIMIVTTIINDVGAHFDAYAKTGWIIAGYSLPNALMSLLWGRIAFSFLGFKTAMLSAIVIFEIGSLICALANSMDMLIGGRVIAGIGGSGIQSLSFVIGSTLVSPRGRGFIIAFMSASFGIASVIGPFIGGAFTSHVTWRWCFWINLPVGAVALVIFTWVYNPTGKKQVLLTIHDLKELSEKVKKVRFKDLLKHLLFKLDIIEFMLISAGIVCILLAFTFGGNRFKWGSYSIILLFVIGGCLVIVALVYDFVIFPNLQIVKANYIQYQPLISWKNLRIRGIFTASMTTFFFCIGYMSQTVYYVQFFQLIYNSSPWKASIHLIAVMIPTVLTAVVCGFLNGKFGYVKPITVAGMCLAVIGAGLLTLLDNHSNSAQHIGLLILPGVAFGACNQCTMMAAQIELDKKSPTFKSDFVAVTTLNSFLKNCGQAVGSIISASVFGGAVMNKIGKSSYHSEIRSVDDLIIYRAEHFDGARSVLGNMISDSVKDVFYMALGWCALAFLFAIFTSNKKIEAPKKGEPVDVEAQKS